MSYLARSPGRYFTSCQQAKEDVMRIASMLLLVGGICPLVWAGPDLVRIDAVSAAAPGLPDRDGGFVLYSNLETPDPNGCFYYYSAYGGGTPFGDDLHMVSGGLLESFRFVYYDPPGGAALSEVQVLFYADDPNVQWDYPGGDPESPLIGSYVVDGLPGDGEWLITADVSAEPLALPADVWMEFDYSDSPDAGMPFYHPATVGFSYPWYEIHGEGVFWFG
jgi:hypothetical protein